jgi:hypothetical protein
MSFLTPTQVRELFDANTHIAARHLLSGRAHTWPDAQRLLDRAQKLAVAATRRQVTEHEWSHFRDVEHRGHNHNRARRPANKQPTPYTNEPRNGWRSTTPPQRTTLGSMLLTETRDGWVYSPPQTALPGDDAPTSTGSQ